jgi:hypothetical protein
MVPDLTNQTPPALGDVTAAPTRAPQAEESGPAQSESAHSHVTVSPKNTFVVAVRYHAVGKGAPMPYDLALPDEES